MIEKLIYIGTANTYGYGSLDALGDETKPMRYPHTQSLYAQSKAEAQKCIDDASSKINIATLSPTFMIGANDTKPSSGKLILAVLNKKIAFYPSGGKNVVAVNDVVHGIIKAFRLKESGRKLILANENLTYKTLFKKFKNVPRIIHPSKIDIITDICYLSQLESKYDIFLEKNHLKSLRRINKIAYDSI
mgnify:CR=1 FL=1